MSLPAFCFATVTSQGYIDQTAGLWLNLREKHPDAHLVVCALDDAGYKAFSGVGGEGVTCIRASTVWGEDYWRNICARMTRSERAFSTKAALPEWVLEQGASAVMILDSDLLFLAPVQDLVEKTMAHDILLVASRHHLLNWRKSNTFGIFSAGIVGFGQSGLPAARIWRAQVFEECRSFPLDGLANEQKYLDYFLGFFDVSIVRDSGINVSPTILRLVEPRQNADGMWVANDGTPIRIYHHSRSADDRQAFAAAKQDYNLRGLARLGGGHQGTSTAERQHAAAHPLSLTRLVRALKIGFVLERLVQAQARLGRSLFDLHRTLTLGDMPLRERWHQTFHAKAKLIQALQRRAFPQTRPEDNHD